MNEKLVQLFPKTNFYRTPVHLHVLPFLKVSLISANVFFNAFLVREQQMWNSVYFCHLMNDAVSVRYCILNISFANRRV